MASPSLVVLLLHLYPAIVVLISIFWLRQSSRLTQLGALGAAILGTVLTISPEGKAHLLGILLGLIAATAYAINVFWSNV